MKRINIGCGNDILKDYINIDKAPLPGVDLVLDINELPLPFDPESVDEILCHDILEHVEYIDLLKDFYRILRPGGSILIRVPHFTSRNNFIDPTHCKRFSINTFFFFVKNSPWGRNYYFDIEFSEVADLRLTFEKDDWILCYNYLAEWFFNLNYRFLDVYEKTALKTIFPAENITLRLVK